MAYSTERTEWPSFEINGAVKDLISHFFALVDTADPKIGNRLAGEVFTPHGRAEFGGHFYNGTEEIRKSRENAWKAISRRRHRVLKIYSASLDGDDLLFIGHVEMDLHNGRNVQGEFVGRLVVEGAKGPSPKLSLFQIWGDSAPVSRALKGE